MADVNTNQATNQQAEGKQETNQQAEGQQGGTNDGNTPTIEELTSQLAAERAEKARNKVALDNALKETGELKKQLRAKLTAEEQESEAKKELEEQQKEYIAGLEKFQKQTLAEKRYILQGMSAEMAVKAAEAEIAGDMDELASIQKQHTDALLKSAKAEWMKSRPQPNIGVGSGASMTKEEIMSIKDPAQRRKAIAENITLFN